MREVTYGEAVREALAEEMRRDKMVALIGEDVGPYGGNFGILKGLWEEFGEERVRDTPISEVAIVGAGLGAALTGMRPVVELMFCDFMGVAGDQLMNQVAKIRYMFGGQVEVPLTIRTTLGGGRSSAAQHSQSLHAIICHVPGIKVVVPGTHEDAKGLLKAAIRENNPVMVFEHKMMYNKKGFIPEGEYITPLGQAAVRREGKDLTIVALSSMVYESMALAEELSEKEGIEIEVIDPRTLVPLDEETILSSVRKTGRLVVADEGHETCGFGAEIVRRVVKVGGAFDYLDAPIEVMGTMDVPLPFSPPLENYVIPSRARIEEAVRKVLGY
ncbi:MAG: alpha-ketoacid dehydrogenase subunit beta [Limnochordia bacterium]|jgi:pyruvate/2-oxoglutarate/acetoin dehydrogenase E1 component